MSAMSSKKTLDLISQEANQTVIQKIRDINRTRALNPKGDIFAWYVVGETKLYDLPFPTFFRTKLQAEEYAHELFPDESIHRRYARIQYREIL